jgi:hypothetical protein
MTAPINTRSNAPANYPTYAPQTAAQPQPQAPARPANTAAQYRANLQQSAFEAPVAPSHSAQKCAPVDSIAVAQPAAPTAPAAPEAPAAPAHPLDQLKQQMSLEDKKAFLEQFGVKGKHLKKAKPEEINKAFDQAIDAMKAPGSTKFKTKIGGKKYEAKINLDANTGELSVNFKQKKSFLGKVGDALKKVGKIALTVAQFIPGPIGVAARVANAVISAVGAFKKGDILGGIAGAAGAIAGGAGAIAGKATAGVARTVANVATAVQRGANAAGSAMNAIKERNWGNLLGAVAGGASSVAQGLGNTAGSVARGLNNVATWATRGQTALQAAAAARNGDILGAIEASSNLATNVAPNSRVARILTDINEFVSPARDARRLLAGG